jgi:hypothetical protein
MVTSRRFLLAGALLAGLCAPTVAAAANAKAVVPVVWEAERLVATAAHVDVHGSYSFATVDGLASFVALKSARTGLVAMTGLTVDTPRDQGPYAYTNDSDYGCSAGSFCDVLSGPGVATYDVVFPTGVPQPDRIYVVVVGTQQQAALVDSPGWKLRKTNLKTNIVRIGSAVGAAVSTERIEHFTHASTTGSGGGSIAIGTLPCRFAHRVGFVREGYGSATLTGGRTMSSFNCGGAPAQFDPVASAPKATRWSLDGDVTGEAAGSTRLIVINF